MTVGLTVSAVIAAHGRLDDALAVFGRGKREKAAEGNLPIRLGPCDIPGLAQGRRARVACDRITHQLPKILIRDLH